jgi:hypothetical protein
LIFIYFTGGWGSNDFGVLQGIMLKYGIGPTSPLYQSFKVLRDVLGIDGVDYDDEALYDTDTTVQFSLLLQSLGYKVSFCPYENMDFWVSTFQVIYANSTNWVTRFNLQCYAGGDGNDPEDWISAIQSAVGNSVDAAAIVMPG